MASLYTNEVRQFLRTREWPKGLIWEIVEFDDFLRFRLYRDNINAFDATDKLQLAKVVNEALSAISQRGIPIYTEVAKGDGRVKST